MDAEDSDDASKLLPHRIQQEQIQAAVDGPLLAVSSGTVSEEKIETIMELGLEFVIIVILVVHGGSLDLGGAWPAMCLVEVVQGRRR
jgi:nicotinate-nucleotide pyrophosphorylase